MTDKFLRTLEDIQEEAEARLERETDPDMAMLSDYLIGELDEEQSLAVRNRIATDPEFRELAAPLLAVYADRPPLVDDPEEVKRSWEKLSRRLGIGGAAPQASDPGIERFRAGVARNKRTAWRRGLMVAAAFVGIAALPQLGARFASWRDSAQRTAWGETATRPLPDGSVAELGSRTRLVQIGDFISGERWVVLRGEATFTVAPIAGRPFVVRTQSADIRVTGTVFHVRAYDNDATAITVTEGSVSVRARGTDGKPFGTAVTLAAGEKARVFQGFPPERAP